jgi:hypothetical protein
MKFTLFFAEKWINSNIMMLLTFTKKQINKVNFINFAT